MLCTAPDITKPTGLRPARPTPSAKPSIQPRNNQASPLKGIKQAQHRSTPAASANGSGTRPAPSPSAKSAAALYRQEPPLLPARSSQLTASLKGKSKGKPSGRPPSGTKPTWQQQMANAANGSAAEGGSAQAGLQMPGDAPWFHQRGFRPLPLQAGSSAGRQEHAAQQCQQPSAQQSADTLVQQSQQARSTGPQPGPASMSDTAQGLQRAAPQASAPDRPSYASKVAMTTQMQPTGSVPEASSRQLDPAHLTESEQKNSKQKQQQGRGRGSGKNRPPVVATGPAPSCEASTAPASSQASMSVTAAPMAQQLSPFASQKSVSFGREAAAATQAAAAAGAASLAEEVSADPFEPPKQSTNGHAALNAQSPFAVHTNSTQQDGQQHPPFREAAATSSCQRDACTEETHQPRGDASSSLGTENRDPKLSQQEARAASDQKDPGGRPAVGKHLAAASQDLLASPFKTSTIDTLPSFTKPLPASKHKEFPSSRSSQQAAAAASEAAPSSTSHVPNQVKSALPDVLSHANKGTQRATAPPDATETTQSHSALAPSSPESSPRADAKSNRQRQTPWDKEQSSPRTPLPMQQAPLSDLGFKQSSSTSGPMASSSHSDSGFSLLWDDDPFWQVTTALDCIPCGPISVLHSEMEMVLILCLKLVQLLLHLLILHLCCHAWWVGMH